MFLDSPLIKFHSCTSWKWKFRVRKIKRFCSVVFHRHCIISSGKLCKSKISACSQDTSEWKCNLQLGQLLWLFVACSFWAHIRLEHFTVCFQLENTSWIMRWKYLITNNPVIILKNMWFSGLWARQWHQASKHGYFSFSASVLRSKTECIPHHKIYATKYLKMFEFKARTICLSLTSVASKQRTIWKVQKALELKRCICEENTWIYINSKTIINCCFLPGV